MAIGDDFTIDYNNKRIHHTSGTTVYSVNALYSWAQETFDELVQMDDQVPMTAQTPTEYTMVNGWWLDIGTDSTAHQFLSGGAIQTSGQTNVIRMLKLETWTGGALTSGDIGTVVDYTAGGDGSTGTLVGYDNTNYYLWVRQDDTGDVFAEIINIIDVGAINYGIIQDVNGSLSGDELFANIYTLGTITTNPYAQVYVFQNKVTITEWSDYTNWDRGQMDIVIQVVEMGTEIDGAVVTIFARQGGDSYSHFEIDLTAGGRNAVPLATASDLDQNTTGDYFMLFDDQVQAIVAGEILTGNTSGSEAEVVAVEDWGTEGVLRLVGVSGDFTNNEDINDSTGTKSAVANGGTTGCIGDTFSLYDTPTGTPANMLDSIVYTAGSSTARRTLIGIDVTNTALVMKATPLDETDLEDQPYHYHRFVDDETITDVTETVDVNMTSGTVMGETVAGYTIHSVAGYSDLAIQHVNLTVKYDAGTVSFTVGDIVYGATSNSEGHLIAQSGTQSDGQLILGNVTGAFQDNENLQVEDATTGSYTTHAVADGTGQIIHTTTKNYELGSSYNYDVIIDMNYYNLAGTQGYHMAPHTVAQLYEYLKFVNRWDSTESLYRVQRPWGKVYDYNQTGTVYTEDTTDWISSTTDDVPFAMTEVEDAMYFGSLQPFNKLHFNLSTEGDHGNTITWEYFNSATWTALTNDATAGVGESAAGATGFDGAGTGWMYVWWDQPTNWDFGDDDGTVEQDYYWVRARVSSWVSVATAPIIAQGYMNEIYNPEDGEEYITSYVGYAEKAASPLGTFAGGVFFGAQGVWIENMVSTDEQAYSLIDSDGTVQDPPNKQAITVTGLTAGDRVSVFRILGNGLDINKVLYTASSGSQYGSSVVMTGSLSNDTPSAGVVRIVDDSASVEYRIRYASWVTTTMTLRTIVTAAATAGGSALILNDNVTNDLSAQGLLNGDLVVNETTGGYAYVDTEAGAIGADIVYTSALSTGTWATGNTYSFHVLPVAIEAATDTAYIPYLDAEATGTSMTVTVIYTANRDVLCRVRNKGYIPFEQESDYGTGGVSFAAVMNEDTIVT